MTTRYVRFHGLSTIALFLALFFVHLNIAAAAQAARDIPMATGIVVKYRGEQRGAALTARVDVAANVARARGLQLNYVRAAALGRHVLRLDQPRPVAEVIALVQAIIATDPEIESAEPDVLMYPMMVPNDPQYSQQWHYHESTGGIRLPQAWDLATGSGIRVAVIDTGYLPHADLAANLLPGYDFMSNTAQSLDGDGRDSDASDPGTGNCPGGNPSSWHGTHVAGTIAAATNNGTGVAGVAFNSQIVPVRVLGCSGQLTDVAEAIIWAAGGSVPGVPANPYPARVLNLSLGGGSPCSSFMQDAVNTARALNAVVVVSAGNDNTDAVNYNPGNCAGVITVAAVDREGNRAQFNPTGSKASNFGSTVEIAAPGGETYQTSSNGVLSTSNTGTTNPVSDSYKPEHGTSMAAPHVAGVAALMLSVNSALTPDQVLSMMQSTARPFPGTCSLCGSGIVHANNAARAALGLPPEPDENIVTFSVTAAMQLAPYFARTGAGPGFGTINPASLGNGKTVVEIYTLQAYGPQSAAVLKISGFGSNPGQSWLAQLATSALTLNGASANFSYGSGSATWTWPSQSFGFPIGSPVNVVLTLQ